MSDYLEILKLIETVDPADAAKMDRLDAQVFCYVYGHRYEALPTNYKDTHNFTYYPAHDLDAIAPYTGTIGIEAGPYSRSRDALKSIRPEGWIFTISNFDSEHTWFQSDGHKDVYGEILTPPVKTEELAELHAIISAIEHERTQK